MSPNDPQLLTQPPQKPGMTGPQSVVIAAIVGLAGVLGSKFIESYQKENAGGLDKTPEVSKVDPSATLDGWSINLEKGIAHNAKSNGFVSAVSGGGQPANGIEMYSGPSPNALVMRMRTASSYSGALMPVQQGEFWMVKHWNGEGTISISWLPQKK